MNAPAPTIPRRCIIWRRVRGSSPSRSGRSMSCSLSSVLAPTRPMRAHVRIRRFPVRAEAYPPAWIQRAGVGRAGRGASYLAGTPGSLHERLVQGPARVQNQCEPGVIAPARADPDSRQMDRYESRVDRCLSTVRGAAVILSVSGPGRRRSSPRRPLDAHDGQGPVPRQLQRTRFLSRAADGALEVHRSGRRGGGRDRGRGGGGGGWRSGSRRHARARGGRRSDLGYGPGRRCAPTARQHRQDQKTEQEVAPHRDGIIRARWDRYCPRSAKRPLTRVIEIVRRLGRANR
jgi:hypothetical protein